MQGAINWLILLRAELRFYRYLDYTKNAIDYTHILAQLKARGLLFKDEERAL